MENVQSYISGDQFNKDKRFTMLCMRDQGVRTTRNHRPLIHCNVILQHHGLKNKVVPLLSELISGSVWKRILEYKHAADYTLPLLIFGDFYSSRKEEQNKYLVDVSHKTVKTQPISLCQTGGANGWFRMLGCFNACVVRLIKCIVP